MREMPEYSARVGNGMRPGRASDGTADHRYPAARSHFLVRESDAEYRPDRGYESEGGESLSRASISVSADARWTGTITVPIPDSDVAFLQIERLGELPPNYRGSEEIAAFSLPIGEFDALIALLTGLVTQARRDGVLPGA